MPLHIMSVEQLKREAAERLRRNLKAMERLYNSQQAFTERQNS